MNCRKIGVFLAGESSIPQRLLEAISTLLPVQFIVFDELDSASCDEVLLFGVSRQRAMEVSLSGVRCMAFVGGHSVTTSSPLTEVTFSSAPCLAGYFRGRKLSDNSIDRISCLKAEAGDEVVARKGDDILWIHRKEGAAGVDLVAMQPPDLAGKEYLYNHFQKDDWARLLPILHFLREVSGWEQPPVRACFMFDDPNLHWKSYGYIKYRELAQHAREHNYHASLATVPMDGWYVHPETAALFRENRNHLSLLIHGNDHTYFELTRVRTDVGRQVLAAQALRRIKRLERLSGLEVPRVMAAPHGACNHDMATVLLRTGFEAACISRSSLMVRNPNTVWPVTVGMNPSEFLGDGLPVVPRFNIRWDFTCALFAAFLGQPVILVGHHGDLADGLDLLEELSGLINSIGEVRWTDMKSITQTNFCTLSEDDLLHVKMYSRKICLRVPEGCTQVCLHRPWLNGNTGEGLHVRRGGSVVATINSYQGEPVSVRQGEEIEIASIYPDMIDVGKVPVSRSSLWAIARRQLSEGRDRLRPALFRLRDRKF
jgi:hypothetical protein